MIELKIERNGGAAKVELTDELLDLLGARTAATLIFIGGSGEPITVEARSADDPRFERGRAFLERYRSTFEVLAKE